MATDFDLMHITAFTLETAGDAARSLATSLTLTLELPTGAQSAPASEQPMGSVVRIELEGKALADELPFAPTLAPSRPALLTLTF